MSLSQNDELVAYLIELQQKLKEAKIPLILGGGLSLYLRHYDSIGIQLSYP